MMTQELIHSLDQATTARGFTPTTPMPSTVARKTDWGRVSIRLKQYRQPVQPAKLREFPMRRPVPIMPASHHWGIVLAGGDGIQMQDSEQTASGAGRPRQFCPVLGNHTLLEETRRLAESSVPPDQILYSVTQEHERYYRRSLSDRPAQTIVQASNKGTAPAMLSALIHIVRTDPNAIVLILPCDHAYSPESAFTAVLQSAFEISEQRSSSVVLLGLEPKSLAVDTGWIEVGEPVSGPSGLAQVRDLQERPALPVAEKLFKAGALWNTFVMVGHVCTFLELAWATVPGLIQALESREAVGFPRGEIRIPDAVYDRTAATDFTRQVLCSATDRLLTLRLSNVEWNDLGDPYRVLVTLLEKTGQLPQWAKLWPLEPDSDTLPLAGKAPA